MEMGRSRLACSRVFHSCWWFNRSHPDGDGSRRKLFLIFPGQLTAIEYWNGTTWAALGTTTNAHPPANPRWMVWHTGRLFVLSDVETLSASQFLDGTVWDRALWSLTVSGDGIPAPASAPGLIFV